MRNRVGAHYDRIIDALADKLPKVAAHLEDTRATYWLSQHLCDER
jgi:hypothetical protein